ncbi:ficolin-1-like [Physella acuta]|uniref:ficolin-1-like n=1 Tax=Physella acuta TaxID=109671 RepID=UPI0027DB01B3|nr:ficolin-1-like [Physella acuta]
MSAGLLAAILAVNSCLCFGKVELPKNSALADTRICSKSHMTKELPARSVLKSSAGKDVLCDTVSDGGGWIVLMRRVRGDVNFSRSWADYSEGFGSFDGDFWLGLNDSSLLIYEGEWQLRVDMKFEGRDYFAQYRQFELSWRIQQHTIHMGTFSGNVTDDFSYHNHQMFYTSDSPTSNSCTKTYSGGWWFNNCHRVYLTGEWKSREQSKGVHWESLTTNKKSLDSVEMKMREIQ